MTDKELKQACAYVNLLATHILATKPRTDDVDDVYTSWIKASVALSRLQDILLVWTRER